jgi:hypothetical protein
MTDPERVPVSENDVLVFRGMDHGIAESGQDESLIAELHERYPKNFIIFLYGDSTFETMELSELEGMLEHLIEHKMAS